MTNSAPFFPQMLSASEYVLALHSPEDRFAVLVRNRTRKANPATHPRRRGNRKPAISSRSFSHNFRTFLLRRVLLPRQPQSGLVQIKPTIDGSK